MSALTDRNANAQPALKSEDDSKKAMADGVENSKAQTTSQQTIGQKLAVSEK